LAQVLADALPYAPAGIRVSGDLDATVRTVAVLGGAGDDLFDLVRASGADVYVTADLRHHPALEAREQARTGSGTPYLIDAGHWASEALWLPLARNRLVAALGPEAARLDTYVSVLCTDPWDLALETGPR
jgi:putative NIF3 family GTP cyclohydrolase 1 type 2